MPTGRASCVRKVCLPSCHLLAPTVEGNKETHMMMHMPWILAVMIGFLVLLLGGALVAVRYLAAHPAVPRAHRPEDETTR